MIKVHNAKRSLFLMSTLMGVIISQGVYAKEFKCPQINSIDEISANLKKAKKQNTAKSTVEINSNTYWIEAASIKEILNLKTADPTTEFKKQETMKNPERTRCTYGYIYTNKPKDAKSGHYYVMPEEFTLTHLKEAPKAGS